MSVSDYIKENFNAGAEISYSELRVTASAVATKCDFLKIDTDGHDLQALHGAQALIDKARPLVIITEAHFNGNPETGDSSVAGVDNYLRDKGYTWLDIVIARYGRAAFPQKFSYKIPASTVEGPVGFADLVHVDDPLSATGKLTDWLRNGLDRSLKMLALYDLLEFPDCAAELIVALSRHSMSADKADWKAMLELLQPAYQERMSRFHADPHGI